MKKAKIFQKGQNQMVLLPEEFHLEDSEVYVKKTRNVVHLIPCNNCWDSLFQSLEKFSDDFMGERVQPEVQTREMLGSS